MDRRWRRAARLPTQRGSPARAVVLVPVVFPIAKEVGIHPVHFNIVLIAAVGIGLFLPPIGVGLLTALRFANISVGQHFKAYWPYLLALSRHCSCSSSSRHHAVPAALGRGDQVAGTTSPPTMARSARMSGSGSSTRWARPGRKHRARTAARHWPRDKIPFVLHASRRAQSVEHALERGRRRPCGRRHFRSASVPIFWRRTFPRRLSRRRDWRTSRWTWRPRDRPMS